jgi:hypothetical protein
MKLVRELRGTRCRCGRVKLAGRTFCIACYRALPKDLQTALYHRLSNGYEQAVDNALAFLVVQEMHGNSERAKTTPLPTAQADLGFVMPGMPR